MILNLVIGKILIWTLPIIYANLYALAVNEENAGEQRGTGYRFTVRP